MSDHAPVLAAHRSGSIGERHFPRVPRLAGPLRTAAAGLAAAGVLTQIAYPLLSGEPLRLATVLSVVLLAGACLVHAGAEWGARGTLTTLAVAGGLGLGAETLGVHTGFPFGTYSYSDSLGAQLVGVPVVVPLAWTMLAYPCLLLGRRLAGPAPGARSPARRHEARRPQARQRVVIALTGGTALAGWDLFLDPQMVSQGHWSWAYPAPALPGSPGVPLTNYAGWILVSVLMIAALDRALPRNPPIDEVIPAAVLAWTWLGSAVGNLVFFDQPWVALYGTVAMGVVTLPYLRRLHRDLDERRRPVAG